MDVATVEISTILSIAAAVTAVGGAWMTIRKITTDHKKQREFEAATILQEAKEEISQLKKDLTYHNQIKHKDLETKIEVVQRDLDVHKETVTKDLSHMRETYNGEIRNLGQKIEELRSELRNQHGQLVGLLTKMIDNRD